MRTAPCTDLLLQPLEEAIRHQFLPAVTGRQGITDQERELLALPVRHGGLGVAIPTRNAKNQFKACLAVTAPLVEIICQRNPSYPTARAEANKVCNSHKESKRGDQRGRGLEAQTLGGWAEGNGTGQRERCLCMAYSHQGPVSKHGFNLHKQAFWDALCLRFGWTPTRLATHCPCGQPFSVNHAFSCPKGAMPSI